MCVKHMVKEEGDIQNGRSETEIDLVLLNKNNDVLYEM